MPKPTLFACVALLGAIAHSTAAQQTRFITVEGPDLKTRIDSAVKLGSANTSGQRFWVAYGFDVRPGVAVDFEAVDSAGVVTVWDGTSYLLSPAIETRNLGIFLLYEQGTSSAGRIEIYNLERKHEYGRHPVYWLGRANNEESIALLKGYAAAPQSGRLAERALFALAIHDDRRVESVLDEFIQKPASETLRLRAISWLGHVPDSATKLSLLTTIARSDAEPREARMQAITALAVTRNTAAFGVLAEIFTSANSRDLRRRALAAIARYDTSEALDLLIKLAGDPADAELRRSAIAHLGQKAAKKALDSLTSTVDSASADTEIQKQAVYAISRRPRDEGIPILIRIARTHPNLQVRKQAIFWLGQSGDGRAIALFREILAK